MHDKRIEIRWRDLDAYGHVNNSVFLTYLEEARDEWLGRVFGTTGALADYVVARVAIDFRKELREADGHVTVRCRIERTGVSSLTTRETILMTDGSVAAEAEVVLVMRNRGSSRSRPITPEERAALVGETNGSGAQAPR